MPDVRDGAFPGDHDDSHHYPSRTNTNNARTRTARTDDHNGSTSNKTDDREENHSDGHSGDSNAGFVAPLAGSSSRAGLIPPVRRVEVREARAVTVSRISSAMGSVGQVSPLESVYQGGSLRGRRESYQQRLAAPVPISRSRPSSYQRERHGMPADISGTGGWLSVSPESSIHQPDDDETANDDDQQRRFGAVGYGGGGSGAGGGRFSPPQQQFLSSAAQARSGGGGSGSWTARDAGSLAQSRSPAPVPPLPTSSQVPLGGGNGVTTSSTAPAWNRQHPFQLPAIPIPAALPPSWPNYLSISPTDDVSPLPQEPPVLPLGPGTQPSYGTGLDPIPVPAPQPIPVYTAAAAADPATRRGGNGVPPMPINPRQTVTTSQPQTTLAALAPAPAPVSARPSIITSNHSSTSPFVRFDEIDLFDPAGYVEDDISPKDEAVVTPGPGLPHADSFPPLPEGANRPEARRSWDRQRRWRKKAQENGEKSPPQRPGSSLSAAPGGEGCLSFFDYCGHWVPEILSLSLSLACLAAIVAVLYHFDGQGLPDWPMGVSLNVLVGFLVALCQVGMAVPLAEGLSQLKWNSFARGEKPLKDFDTFERAVRGGGAPWGAAWLLVRRKGRVLGMSAALVLMTGFLLSPLTQGAITYPTRRLEAGGGSATISRSLAYAAGRTDEQSTAGNLDPLQRQAIHSALFQPSTAAIPPIYPTCSSGTCTFTNVTSLAICTAVSDLTSQLTISNVTRARALGILYGPSSPPTAPLEPVRNASLSNGAFLVGSATAYALNISSPPSQDGDDILPLRNSLALRSSDGRVASGLATLFMIYANDTANELDAESPSRFRADEVLFYFCINTYNVSVERGVPTSVLIDSNPFQDDSSGIIVDSEQQAEELRSRTTDDQQLQRQQQEEIMTGGGGTYSVRRDDARVLSGYLRSVIKGLYSRRYGERLAGVTTASGAIGAAMYEMGPATGFSELDVRGAVKGVMENVAASLTNAIRVAATTNSPTTQQQQQGTVLTTETYVHIRWEYLTLLFAQVVTTILFLSGLMIQTAVWQVKILKGSAIAPLFALSARDRAHLDGPSPGAAVIPGGNSNGVNIDDGLNDSEISSASVEGRRRTKIGASPMVRRDLKELPCLFTLGGDGRGWALEMPGRRNGEG